MNIPLPRINGEGFAKTLFMNQGRREFAHHMKQIGSINFAWLIENDKSIYEFLKPIIGAHEDELRNKVRGIKWITGVFSDEDVISMMPEWFTTLVAKYPQGPCWLTAQLKTIREFFI